MGWKKYVLPWALALGAAGASVGYGVDFLKVEKNIAQERQKPDSTLDGLLIGACVGLVCGALKGLGSYDSNTYIRNRSDDDFGPECNCGGASGCAGDHD